MDRKKTYQKKWEKPEVKKLPFKQTLGGSNSYNTENAAAGFYES